MYLKLGDVLQNSNKRISKKYGILMVATNDYINLWQKTVLSLQEALDQLIDNVNVHVFTNRVEDCKKWADQEKIRISIDFHDIPGWGWPEATLLRYDFFARASSVLNEEILIYLDSDMQVRSNFLESLDPDDWKNGLALVAHPGYVRFKGFSGLMQRIKFPKVLVRDLINIFSRKKPGAWESNQFSSAFVPREKQKTYVHGAIWMGKNTYLKELVALLSDNTSKDLEAGVIAKWHDESHLNWFCSNFEVTILDSRYSGFDRYKYLKKMNPMIVSLEKEKNFGRQITKIEI
jgi:hypothetical protein